MCFKSSFTTLAVAAISFCIIGGTTPAHADLGDQLFKLLSKDGAANDQFGISVSISGATAIVGVYLDDDNGPSSGSAYLFDTTTGTQIFKLLPDDGAALDRFGISVAISGTPGSGVAVVGAYLHDENGSSSGSAYLFDTTTGHQIAELLPDDGAAGDEFGISVAISPDGIGAAIVGAHHHDDNGSNSGSAYLFDISDPANPTQLFKLLTRDGAAGDGFGVSVAINGETAIIGAFADDDNGENSGSAYLFDISTGKQIAKLIANDGDADDHFGYSVAISGTTVVVAARWDDDNGIDSGSAYIFDISDLSNPTQIATILPKDGEEDDFFGWSVAISCNTVIAGAIHDDDNGAEAGAAYLFDATNSAPCPWDLDMSGSVGTNDLLELFAQWGTAGPADFDGSGAVGTNDLLILFANWGPCP